MVEKGPRHFPYIFPTFGTKARPKGVNSWEKSPYYWWWHYLRRSERYRLACAESGGTEFAKLYADFGDVRDDDFKAWWNDGNRGARLFAEPNSEDVVRVIARRDELAESDSALVISLPLSLPKRYLMKQVRLLLARHHGGRRGYQMAKKSHARFRFRGQPNWYALKMGLRVYDHWKTNPGIPLWKIGNTVPMFQMEQKIEAADESLERDKKNVLAATVSRYLRRVEASIAATEQGQFP